MFTCNQRTARHRASDSQEQKCPAHDSSLDENTL